MNRLGLIKTACTALVALMLAACTQDEGMDGIRLSEGEYPFTLTAEMGGLGATTRATADGTWTADDEVALQVTTNNNAGVKKYTTTATGTLTSTDPFYWQASNETKQVSAWYLGTGYNVAQPTTWSVQSVQNQTEVGKSSDNYQRSDFLYAPQTGISYGDATKALTFYHQTAKVVINIRKAGTLTQASQITAVSINNVILDGSFSVSDANNTHYGLTAASTSPKSITPRELASPNNGVDFGDGSSEAALVSYEALVIPQTVTAGENFIGITVDGTNYYYKAVGNYNKLDAGHVHTYNITVIEGKQLQVTVSNSNMGWTGGSDNEGSGNVVIPTKINLNTAGAVTINDNKMYLITGNGTNTVTISSGIPTVIFDNVSITPSSGAPINITGGIPQLHFKGNNTLTCQSNASGGIVAKNNAHIIIKGDGASTKLTIKNSNSTYKMAGIGPAVGNPNSICGNITISDITMEITSLYCSGIGASYASTCGNISITDATLNITSTNNAACIGASVGDSNSQATCGDITIRNCTIIGKSKGEVNSNRSAAIGISVNYAKCGNITIYADTPIDFCNLLEVENNTWRVGWGVNTASHSSIGNINWYTLNGEYIFSGKN